MSENLEIDRQTKQTKLERYKWKVQDTPGEFAMIHKDELIIDHAYQRKLSKEKMLTMASDWSWVACGAISVGLREPDAKYVVIDGQHRAEAARRRADITMLPCMIFGFVNVSEEAKGFLVSNTLRKPVSMAARHKALVMTGNKPAIILQELANAIGRGIAPYTGPAVINCVGVLLKILEEDEAAARRAFAVTARVCQGQSFTREVLVACYYCERHLPQGSSLATPLYIKRLMDRGFQAITEGIRHAIALNGSGSPRTCAMGLLAVLNKHARSNVLCLEGDDEQS